MLVNKYQHIIFIKCHFTLCLLSFFSLYATFNGVCWSNPWREKREQTSFGLKDEVWDKSDLKREEGGVVGSGGTRKRCQPYCRIISIYKIGNKKKIVLEKAAIMVDPAIHHQQKQHFINKNS